MRQTVTADCQLTADTVVNYIGPRQLLRKTSEKTEIALIDKCDREEIIMKMRRLSNPLQSIERSETRCDMRLIVKSVLRLIVSAADAFAACGVTATSISFHRRKQSMLRFVSHRIDDSSAYRRYAKMPRCECVSP